MGVYCLNSVCIQSSFPAYILGIFAQNYKAEFMYYELLVAVCKCLLSYLSQAEVAKLIQ